MFCKNCGEKIKKEASFCKHCGQKVITENNFITSSIEPVKSNEAIVQTGPVKSSTPEEKDGNFKKFLPFIAGALFLIVIFYLAFGNTSSDNKVNNSQSIAQSVVNILCTSKNGEDYGGSGTIMSEDGLILTNAHIIPQINEAPNVLGGECLVVIPDESMGQPKEMYYGKPEITKTLSKDYDIATIQITSAFIDEDGKSWGIFPNKFPAFQDAPNCEGEMKLGDQVKIYGYPITSGGYNLTITEGIISSFSNDGFVLTSAKVDSGNSGGLAIDQYGCFIGIPSAVVEGNYQNLGVIIPPNLIKDFINEVPYQTSGGLISCDSDECYYNGKCLKNPPHSYCVEDDPNNAWLCDAGYVESGNYCVLPVVEKTATQLCQEAYGWNSYSDGTYCDCVYGYGWNLSQTACITNDARCSEKYPNTYFSKYDTDGKMKICDCIYGYVWDINGDSCVTKASIDQACQRDYGYYSYYLGYVKDGKYICQSY